MNLISSVNLLSLFTFLFLSASSGCILPPENLQPSVIDSGELAFLSLARRGKENAQSGRMDLAELYLRKAAQLKDDEDFIYNDLGFALLGQNRSEEAIAMFQKAQELEPENLVVYLNLARAYYAANEIEKALAVYEELLEKHYYFPYINLDRTDVENLSEEALVDVLRNMSILYSLLGYIDESLCFSQRALDRAGNLDETIKHARLLLSFNKVHQASEMLRATITVRRGDVPPEVFLDYAVSLVAKHEDKLAAESLARVLSNELALQRSRTIARVLKYELLRRSEESEAEEFFEEIIDESPELCEWDVERKYPYWPFLIQVSLEKSLSEGCERLT